MLGIYDVYGGGPEAALRSGAQVPVNDPLLVVPAMAAVTEHLGFGITASTSFEHPYSFARRMSTLDHLTKGRVGWNIVTGYLESAARNHGLDTITPARRPLRHRRRVHRGRSTSCGRAPGRTTPSAPIPAARTTPTPPRCTRSSTTGSTSSVPGIHLCEPSPQRTPVLYQAGASNRGKQFGAENAEVIFIGAPTKEVLREAVADIRARAAAAGRDPYDVKIVNGHVVVTGATEAAAQARYDDFRRYTDPEGALALWSGWLGTDLSRFDLDDPVARHRQRVPQVVGGRCSARASGRCATSSTRTRIDAEGGFTVGSPTQVADDLQEWVEETDVDGFNLTNAITPGIVRRLHRPRGARAAAARGVQDRPTTKARCATSCSDTAHACPKPTARPRYRRVTEEVTR